MTTVQHFKPKPSPDRDAVLGALAQLRDPARIGDVVSNGRISGVAIRPGEEGAQVGFLISILPEESDAFKIVRQQAEDIVSAVPGVAKVIAVLTAQTAASAPMNAHQEAATTKGAAEPSVRAKWNLTPLPGVKRIIAVASGKGGVGKSSVTLLLAHALAATGVKVGIVDADIHGPSVARMLGLGGQQPGMEKGLMLPTIGHGIPALSMGQLAGESEALVWRGPQLSKMLQQLLRGADWQGCYNGQGLDVLLVDMPPGTGDVQLTLAQQVPLDGVLIVTIPSHIAVIDAAKSATMFGKLNIPILGIIENMSGIEHPDGSLLAVFGAGGGARLAEQTNTALLAQLPLWPSLGPVLDAGQVPDNKQLNAIAPIMATLTNS